MDLTDWIIIALSATAFALSVVLVYAVSKRMDDELQSMTDDEREERHANDAW